MYTSPTHAVISPPAHVHATPQPSRFDDWAYQGLTIAAMLIIIASFLSFW